MERDELLAREFESHRRHLHSVAYRMLGSFAEADDAVQETWFRLSRADTDDVENMRGWLTTVTARVCLNVLRARRSRPDEPAHGQLPDPLVTAESTEPGPEHDVLTADSVSLALLVVLERLSPAERLAFVLHDVFAVPFEEIAPVVDRSPAATRQLASRARRRVRGVETPADVDPARRRAVVDAFFAAALGGDLDGLVALLDPDVVLRSDRGPGLTATIRGAQRVAGQAVMFADPAATLVPVLVNGAAGVVVVAPVGPVAVMGFTVRGERIVAIDALNDRDRLLALDLPTRGR